MAVRLNIYVTDVLCGSVRYSVLPSAFLVFVTLVMCMSVICSLRKPNSSLRYSIAVFISVTSFVSLVFLSMSSVFMG